MTTLAYEQQEAARFCGLTWAEYMALPGNPDWVSVEAPTLCKAEVLAMYRTNIRLNAVQEDIRAANMKRRRGKHTH